MTTYLSTAFSFNMIDVEVAPKGAVQYEMITVEEAAELAKGAENVIGHASTAIIVGNQLFDSPLSANRVNVSMVPGDQMVIAQYFGPRLEEGAMVLPEGAEIKYMLIRV